MFSTQPIRLAVVATHPIQYYAPWFRHLSRDLEIKVFYLWDFGVTEQIDHGFGKTIQWDVPLLSGYEYEFVPNTSRKPGTHHFRGLKNPNLKQRIASYDPTAVLFMGYNYESFYRLLSSWTDNRVPLLLRGDSHRLLRRKGLTERFRRRFIKKVFKHFSAFLYVGKANQTYYQYHGIPSSKLFFAPHAVDNDYFTSGKDDAEKSASAWRRELGIPPNHAVVMFVGKFEEKKRPRDLLEAFVSANLQDATLLFVGSGALDTELRSLGLKHPNICFASFQNQSMMPRTYAAADLLVLPSYGPRETWGLAVNEAMCLSRPVIVSDHVGCAQDLVTPHENGLIFRAGDIPDLVTCLRTSLRNRDQLRDWGRRSREVIERYNYRETTKGLKEALSEVL